MELKIESANAIRAYRNGGKEVQSTLEDIFGKDIFNQPITERVKTFNDACQELGISAYLPFEFDDELNEFYENMVAHYKLLVIAKALNEGWTPDWSDKNQPKYYAWFEFRGSGVGFAFDGCVYAYARTPVGSRLCFKNSELATYFGKQFIDIHKIILEQ